MCGSAHSRGLVFPFLSSLALTVLPWEPGALRLAALPEDVSFLNSLLAKQCLFSKWEDFALGLQTELASP